MFLEVTFYTHRPLVITRITLFDVVSRVIFYGFFLFCLLKKERERIIASKIEHNLEIYIYNDMSILLIILAFYNSIHEYEAISRDFPIEKNLIFSSSR